MTTPETPQPPQVPQNSYPAAPQVPQQAPQNSYPAAPQPGPAPQSSGSEPGKVLGIVGLILAFLMPLIGLILGIVALVQSKKAGRKNGIAVAAIIIGAILLVVGIIVAIVVIASLAAFGGGAMEVVEACQNGAVSVEFAGQTFQCSDVLSQ